MTELMTITPGHAPASAAKQVVLAPKKVINAEENAAQTAQKGMVLNMTATRITTPISNAPVPATRKPGQLNNQTRMAMRGYGSLANFNAEQNPAMERYV